MSLNDHREAIGNVTEEEKKEVLVFFEKMMGLQELLPVLEAKDTSENGDSSLYDRVVQDLGAAKRKQSEWWSKMAQKYNWKSAEKGMWSIDFDTNSIYLSQPVN